MPALDPDGTIRLIDEIHTPGSIRHCLADIYAQRLARRPIPTWGNTPGQTNLHGQSPALM